VTFTIQAPTMMPSMVMDPSNPFLIKYRLAMGLISVIRRYDLTFLKRDLTPSVMD
jgi:hypothetical protein